MRSGRSALKVHNEDMLATADTFFICYSHSSIVSERMEPKTRFFIEISSIAALGVFFVMLGIYFAGTYLCVHSSARGIFIGGACIFLGLSILWWIYQFAKPQKTALKPPEVCPYCGALNEYNVTNCQKCQRPLNNSSRVTPVHRD